MRSLDVANRFITEYGASHEMTNLRLNKLVYYTQAVFLRRYGEPLFEDDIQAWAYGPVEPLVYHAFSMFGRNIIRHPQGVPQVSERSATVIRDVMDTFGRLTAFDLVRLSHREGGAWLKAYRPNANVVITPAMILESRDGETEGIMDRTLAEGVELVRRTWPNAMRMLEDS